MYWAVAMQMYDGIVGPDEHSAFEDFWAAVLDSEFSFTSRLLRSVKRFSERDTSAADAFFLPGGPTTTKTKVVGRPDNAWSGSGRRSVSD